MKQKRCPTCGRREKRSNPANARMWLLLHVISDKLRPQGVQHSADTWHYYFKTRFLGCDEIAMPNSKVLNIPRSTADLPADVFSDYVTKIEAWAAERGVFLDELAA